MLLLWVIGILVITCIIYFLFFHLDWEAKELNKGFSSSAQKNHFLAANMFLNKMGKVSQYTSQLYHLDNIHQQTSIDNTEINLKRDNKNSNSNDSGISKGFSERDVLILLDARGSLSYERYANILAWVEGGGTLVYDVDNRFLSGAKIKDAFLDKFDLIFEEYDKRKTSDIFGKTLDNIVENSKEDKKNKEEDSGEVYLEEKFFDPEYINNEDDVYDPELNSENGLDSNSEFDDLTKELSENALHNERSQKQNFSEENINCSRFGMPSEPAELGAFELSASKNNLNQYTLLPNASGTIVFSDDAKKPYQAAYLNDHLVYAEYRQGLGRIIFGVDWNIWNNHNIACADHAFYLSYLAKNSNKVWFFQNLDAPSLWYLLWSKAYIFGFFTCLALVFYLWYLFIRFGPIIECENYKQRQFLEHLKAVGYLAWRSKHSIYLIQSLYKETVTKIQRHSPNFLNYSIDEKCDFFMQQAAISKQSAQDIIRFTENHFVCDDSGIIGLKNESNIYKITPQNFIHIVSILKTIKAYL